MVKVSETVILALIASVPGVLAALGGILTAVIILLRKQEQTHKLVNSRMTELLEVTREASTSAGQQQERIEQRERVERADRGEYPGRDPVGQ